jgi:hypothetical protein
MIAACPLGVGIGALVFQMGEGVIVATAGNNCDTLANAIETMRVAVIRIAILLFNFFFLSYFSIGDTVLLILFKSLLCML